MLDANRVIPELALPGRVVNNPWGRFEGEDDDRAGGLFRLRRKSAPKEAF